MSRLRRNRARSMTATRPRQARGPQRRRCAGPQETRKFQQALLEILLLVNNPPRPPLNNEIGGPNDYAYGM